MNSMRLQPRGDALATMEELYSALSRRVAVSSLAPCPVDFIAAFVGMCQTQSCGKCTPCRVGLVQLETLIDDILDGEADCNTIDLIERTARDIYLSADCAIGYEPAAMALDVVRAFRDDFEFHIAHGSCGYSQSEKPPCVSGCPAEVDIPGYIALAGADRFNDAVRLIRMDNPLAVSCCLICEHPCERFCRRGMVDDPLNIRGLKHYVVENADNVPLPPKAPKTGKRIAVVGGGVAGLSAGYFLTVFGHEVTIFEQRHELGGMLRYGIPNYRLPKDSLDAEIDWLLSAGIHVRTDVAVGIDISMGDLRREFDAVYLAIGAHAGKRVGMDNEDAPGVVSAVQMLRDIGDGMLPDYNGHDVVVIGGGNVAVDAARSSVRLGARSVTMVYRRRIEDMTALAEEIEGAEEEGVTLLELHAPSAVEVDDKGRACALIVQPQIIGPIVDGRAKPRNAKRGPVRIPCDVVITAIGQEIDSESFSQEGIPINRRKTFIADAAGRIDGIEGVFAGGDCVLGPETVIKAAAAGKKAATTIDRYLGFNHRMVRDIDIPPVSFQGKISCARSNTKERDARTRVCDFEGIEIGLTHEEAMQEAHRCLRCDHFGFGAFKGGRSSQW